MRYGTLAAALALCVLAAGTIALDAPWRVSLLVVGAFMLLAPGLLVVHVLDLPDRLLSLVVGLVVGPSAWVVVACVELFAGAWAPRPTVLVAAGLLGVLSLWLAGTAARREGDPSPALDTPATDARVEHHTVDDAG